MIMDLKNKLIISGVSASLALAGVGIASHEGYLSTAYLDPKKILTVCYGHTAKVVKNKKYSEDECLKLFGEDLKYAENVLIKAVNKPVYVKLKDHEKAAFVSFIFNVGPGKKDVKDGFVELKNGNTSTMLTKLNRGDVSGACNEFTKWNKDKLKGIEIRRQKERDLCLNTFKKY